MRSIVRRKHSALPVIHFGAELGERTLVPGADARLGEIRFEEWLGKSVIQAVPA